MGNKMKRFLSVMIAVMLLLGTLSWPAFAEEGTTGETEAATVVSAEEPAATEVTADQPAIQEEAPAEEPVAEPVAPEAPAEEPAAEPAAPEAPVEEPAAEPAAPEAPVEEPAAEPAAPEAPVEEPAAEPAAPEAPVEEPAAEPAAPEAPVEEPAAEPAASEAPAEEPAAEPATPEAPAEEPVAEPAAPEAPAEEPAAEPAAPEAPAEEPVAETVTPEVPAEKPVAEPAAPERPSEESAEESSVPAEESAEEPIAPETLPEEPVVEPAAPEAPAEESVEESAAPETQADEPPVAEPADENAFRIGLAQISAGDVFVDEKCRETAGRLTAQTVAYVTDRVTGEGDMDPKDIMRVSIHVDGEIKAFYIRFARIAYLTDAQVDQYLSLRHPEGIEYRGVQLDPAAFEPVQTETPAATDPVKEAVPEPETPAESEPVKEEIPGAEDPAAAEPVTEEAPETETPAAAELAQEGAAEEEAPVQETEPEAPTITFIEQEETTPADTEKATVPGSAVPVPVVQTPVVTTTAGLSISDTKVVSYDYVTNGSLTIRWSAKGSNGIYSVRAILINDAPVFVGTARNVVATKLDTTGQVTSLTLTQTDMAKAKYLKVWIQARDVNYAQNGGTRAMAFGIRFTPAARVAPVTVSASPAIAILPNTIGNYDFAAKGNLTLRWSARNGNGKYSVKAILINDVPSFTSAARQVVKAVLVQDGGTGTTLTVSAADMRNANYLKVLIQAQDAHYDQNGAMSSFQFAFLLRPEPKVTLSVRTNPTLSVTPNATITYDQVAKGALTISWSATNGNGRYIVMGVMANSPIRFGSATPNVTKTVVSLADTTTTSITIPLATLKLGKYLKFVVKAEDVNYARNGAVSAMEFGIQFTPTPQVATPVINTTPYTSPRAYALVDYYVANGDLVIHWGAAGSNGVYSYAAVVATKEPIFGQPTYGVVKKVIASDVKATSLTISQADLQKGAYVKLALTAQDENYLQNGATSHIEVGFRLKKKTYRALLIGEKSFVSYDDSKGYYWDNTERNVSDTVHMASMLSSVSAPDGGKYTVTRRTDQSYDQIKSLIRTTFAGTTDDDVSLFFIATHGNSSGDGELAMPFLGSTVQDLYDFYGSGKADLSFATLASWLKTYVKGEVIVILESCGAGSAIYSASEQNGPARNATIQVIGNNAQGAKPKLRSYDPGTFVSRAASAFAGSTITLESDGDVANSTGDLRVNKFYVLAAARHREMSWGYEGSNSGNYFTDWLIEGVGTSGSRPADQKGNKDGFVNLTELFNYIKQYDSRTFYSDGVAYHQHVQRYPVGSTYKLFK